jgi:hypothetical protein
MPYGSDVQQFGFESEGNALVSAPPMARRSLRPHLNQIRGWVRQGRTDAWIAHQLEVTVQQIQAFKRENDLAPDGNGDADVPAGADFDDEVDLRAEDDALIAAELEAEEAARAKAAEEAAEADDEVVDAEDEAPAEEKPSRPRRRRGGRGRRKSAGPLEATFDHGEEGYGLWLDPAVVDDPVYAEHWAGHRPVEVTIEENRIVIRRAGEQDDED